jgi:hypothetical protein
VHLPFPAFEKENPSAQLLQLSSVVSQVTHGYLQVEHKPLAKK